MKPRRTLTRRRFLQSSSLALAASGLSRVRAAGFPDSPYRHLISPQRKLRIACVGVGGKGRLDVQNCSSEEIVALCDVDFRRGASSFQQFLGAVRYRDYQQMLDELGDKIDAVTVTTPDHTHFPVALMAIERGKHVYVQKPLTHTVAEARILKAAAAKAAVVTQMGNQGHANEGTRLVKEWIEADVIGPVREVHTWTDRPQTWWPQGAELKAPLQPVPPTFDWNLWLGVAARREYSDAIAPYKWRGWWNYGCGALGDMGCHNMDAPFWALNLRGPVKISTQSDAFTEELAPKWSIITYEFPARGTFSPLKYVWYDGGKLPPVPEELGPGAVLGPGGTYYRGDKGVIFSGSDTCESPRLIPESRMKDFKRPPRTIPRVPESNPYLEWINACKGGPRPGANIVDHSADLTEFVLLGNVALRSGRPIQWDPVRAECVGLKAADRFLRKDYRLF